MLNNKVNQTFDITVKISLDSDIRFQIIENLKNKRICILEDENKAINHILTNIIESVLYINTNHIHLQQLIENYFNKNEEEYLLDNCENGLFISL